MLHPHSPPNRRKTRNLIREVTIGILKRSVMPHIVVGTIHHTLTTTIMAADSPAVSAPKGDPRSQLLEKTLCTLLTKEATR